MTKKKLIAAFAVLLIVLSGAFASNMKLDYSRPSSYEVGNGTVKGKVDSISVDWINGLVKIVPSDRKDISIEEKAINGRMNDDLRLRWKVEGRELKIQYARGGVSLDFGKLEKELIIYIPESMTVKEFEFEGVSADLDIGIRNIRSFDFQSVSGDLSLSSESINDIDTETVSGDIDITLASLSEIEADSVSGNIVVRVSKDSPRKAEFRTLSGDVDIAVPENASFTLETSSVSGDTSISLPFEVRRKNTYSVNGGKNSWSIDSISGDIRIKAF